MRAGTCRKTGIGASTTRSRTSWASTRAGSMVWPASTLMAGNRAPANSSAASGNLGCGVFMPSAKGDLLPDEEAARPTLAAAAALQVPVFLHPVADGQLFARFKRFGPLGMRLTRGTINSAALFAIIDGLFEELPNLRVVVT